jgi:hypothetical protein
MPHFETRLQHATLRKRVMSTGDAIGLVRRKSATGFAELFLEKPESSTGCPFSLRRTDAIEQEITELTEA